MKHMSWLAVCAFVSIAVLCPQATTQVDIPAPQQQYQVLPPVEDSTINLRATVDLRVASQALDRALPRTFGENRGGEIVQYGIYPSPPSQVTADRTTFRLRLPFVYKAGIPGVASCGFNEAARRAELVTNSPLTLQANWSLGAAPSSAVNLIDKCTLTLLGIDVTGLVQDKANAFVPTLNQEIRNRIGAINFRPTVQEAWSRIAYPLAVAPNVWLTLNPKLAMAAHPNGTGTAVELAGGVVARPQVMFSSVAPQSTAAAFPPLTVGPLDDRFHIAADAIVSYDEANRLLQQHLRGKSLDFTIDSWWPFHRMRRIQIADANVLAAGEKLALKVVLNGDFVGTVYFSGRPTYVDGNNASIRVDDLDFTLQTKQLMPKALNWVLHKKFVDVLRGAAVFPLNENLNSARDAAAAALNRTVAPGIVLAGTVRPFEPKGIFLANVGIVARAMANGAASLTVSPALEP